MQLYNYRYLLSFFVFIVGTTTVIAQPGPTGNTTALSLGATEELDPQPTGPNKPGKSVTNGTEKKSDEGDQPTGPNTPGNKSVTNGTEKKSDEGDKKSHKGYKKSLKRVQGAPPGPNKP